jgi:ABC transport system ATP-binding/permease protein
MSEKILKALMQLFAIIARPESKKTERRLIVELFLRQQLNEELANEYLRVFDYFYEINQSKNINENLIKKRTSSSSVRVLKICTEINKELTQKQKTVVLVRLLEFIKSDSEEITDQELEFVDTVSETFNIQLDEYKRIKGFVIYSFTTIPNSSKILLIDNNKDYSHPKAKHIYSESLDGQIRVLYVSTIGMFLIRYLGNSEVYLSGQLLHGDKAYILTVGTSLRSPKISPVYYSDIINVFNKDENKSKIIFEAKNIEYNFKGDVIGLHRINFHEESGKLIGIMGASGAGKTTLLNVLNGTMKPSVGEVLINKINIHNENEKVRGLIGYVSQDDLLIEELTVFQNLFYNAKLCFGNYTDSHIINLVLTALNNLGLFEIKDMKVGSPLDKKISGGQRKRLNIALELIREPSVLFLDEPTSGLSSRDSENILDLLKDLSFKDKLVFVVLHQPSSEIFKMFDELLILDTGGFLIYKGNPVDSIIYFKSKIHQADWNESECKLCKNVNPEQIFNIIESKVIDEYGNHTHTRKTTPKEWSGFYEKYEVRNVGHTIVSPHKLPETVFKTPGKFKQFRIFVIRDILAKIANSQYLYINLLEVPILSALLSILIRYFNVDIGNKFGYNFSENSNIPVYIFMSVIIAIFVGLSVSAEEIIKDRKILKRESFLNLSWSGYLFSKIIILFSISAIQALLLVIIGNPILGIKGMYWQYWLVLFSTWSFSNLLGLNISNSFKTAINIYILIPFLVIPQIILSGILVKFDRLNPDISPPNKIPLYGEIITARWAFEALAVYQFQANDYEKIFYPYDKIISVAKYKKDYWLKSLYSKIESCQNNLKYPDKKNSVINDLQLLNNEISKEMKSNRKIHFNHINSLNYNKISAPILDSVYDFCEKLNKYYIRMFNLASSKKDEIIAGYLNNESDKDKFLLFKKMYYNECLKEFVQNDNEINRIVEYNNHMYQKMDPIFQDPTSNFIKAQFYAPQKKLFGKYFDTFWVNIYVIWFMSIFLYFTLYFNVLKKILNIFEQINIKKSKRN